MLAAAWFCMFWSWRLGERPEGEARWGGEPIGDDPLMAGDREPPAAGDVGGEKRGEDAGEPPPDRGSEATDIAIRDRCWT